MLVPGLIWAGTFTLLPILALGGDEFIDMLSAVKPIAPKLKLDDSELQDLQRDPAILGTLPDSDWAGIADRKIYNYNDNNKVEVATGGFFRASNKQKTRGSKVKTQAKAIPFPHKPDPQDPEGCGNPVCVVIDRKPRRFKSICQLKTFLKNENRLSQINFVQKGDCYDIIDNDVDGGATKKPWSDNAKDCSKCAAAENCNGPVVFIIDINSYMKGMSSAPGGDNFNDAKFGGKKMAGFPFEFCNICEAMKFFQTVENVNAKTQVVGLGFGNVNAMFPLNGGDNCMWTEYFDHDAPCNSDEDKELHSEHFRYLQSSYTGALRVCAAEDIIAVCHEGGSEITQIKAEDAIAGQAVGSNGEKFDQILQVSKQSIVCKNQEQKIKQLPPPFIYADDKNNTCLDYKARYCCRTSKMWRPMGVEVFGSRIPPSIPFGVAWTTYKRTGENICFTIVVSDGVKGSRPSTLIIDVKSGEGKGTIISGKMICGSTTTALNGNFEKIERPDKSSTYTFSLYNPSEAKQLLSTISIYLHWDEAAIAAVATTIKDESGVVSVTQVLPAVEKAEIEPTPRGYGKPPAGYGSAGNTTAPAAPGGSNLFDDIKWDMRNTTLTELLKSLNVRSLYYQTVMVDKLSGVKTIVSEFRSADQFTILKSEGALNVKLSDNKNLWQSISQVLKTYSISIVVESPPLAHLFHECEWKDWVNQDYPANLWGQDGEYELRDRAAKVAKLAHTVCGTIPESAHYIDAITTEDQVPWYELKMDENIYQTFKLTPFFGYACKDKNGPKEFCKDMKVRYCCQKALRATWGEWGAWSSCDKTCGGGCKKRKRECVQDEAKKDSPGYNPLCYGQDGKSASAAERYSTQTVQCNLEACPEDGKFMPWTGWTACSLSCGQGTKTRTRYCLPSIGGGKPCPDEMTNRDLYVNIEQCTQKDCEQYIPTQWSAWSSCSSTCDKGVMTRNRKCVNDKTFEVVPNDRCTNGQASPEYVLQTQNCLLQQCPVNGMWATWSAWGLCSQQCIYEPEEGKPIETRANRKRERFCANPEPAFGGEPCKRDEKFEFDSRLYAEKDKTTCITPGSKEKGPVTPWCPEHCIYTQWGDWSLCSTTCLPINAKVQGYDNTKMLIGIHYKNDHPQVMPTRSRVKIMVRPEKNGGVCEEKKSNFDQPGSFNGTCLHDKQECNLCKEHCPVPTKDFRLFPKLDYPGNDPSCIGYCPESCKWTDMIPFKNCEEAKKAYLEEKAKNPNIVNNTAVCFDFTFRRKAWENQATEVMALWDAYIWPISEGKVPFPDSNDFGRLPPELANFLKEDPDVDEILKDAKSVLSAEMARYESILYTEERKTLKEPYLDGLVGGENCVDDKSRQITSNEKLQKEDKKKYSKLPYVNIRAIKCQLDPCKPDPIVPGQNQPPCKYTQWTEWGDWGKCDIKCGDDGIRKRNRKCINTCTNEELKNEECRPLVDPGRNRTWTDTGEGACTPCPAESQGTWSLWTAWAYSSEPKCNAEGKGSQEYTRERRCIEGPDVKECAPTRTGLKTGIEKEKQEIPEPKCPEINKVQECEDCPPGSGGEPPSPSGDKPPGGEPAPAGTPAPGGQPTPAPGGPPTPAPGGETPPAPGGETPPAPGGETPPAGGSTPAPGGGAPAPPPGGEPTPAPGGQPPYRRK